MNISDKQIIIVFLILLIVFVIYQLIKILLKLRFSNRYGIELPKNIELGIRKKGSNYFEFGNIFWLKSKKDGTNDKRYKSNTLIKEFSKVYIDEFVIKSKNPFELYNIVRELRKCGLCQIERHELEKAKLNYNWEKLNKFLINKNTSEIVNRYVSDPYGFERLCKDLYEKQGYNVYQTPKVKDGGCDLIIEKDGKRSIVECKCYRNGNIGRPLLQKMVGANQIFQADGMIFVTTSSFSKDAIEYAKKTRIEIVDGEKLLELINNIDISLCEIEVRPEYWELTQKDIMKLYPKDLYI